METEAGGSSQNWVLIPTRPEPGGLSGSNSTNTRDTGPEHNTHRLVVISVELTVDLKAGSGSVESELLIIEKHNDKSATSDYFSSSFFKFFK